MNVAQTVQPPLPTQPRTPSDAPAGACTLYVDLDGTLVVTDTLWESCLLLVRHRPLDLFRLPFWLAGGKANFKRQIASRTTLNAAALPYRKEVIEFLETERSKGRSLILATAADRSIAEGVANHLNIFDGVIATSDGRNAAGEGKVARIREHAGEGARFAYLGDSMADLPVWRAASESYVAASSQRVAERACDICKPVRVFAFKQGGSALHLIRAMRPHQWAKNLLVFVPLFCSHQFTSAPKLLAAAVAFIAFGLCASAGYLFNDLLDLEADRLHPRKRNRPLAAGLIPIQTGIAASFLLLAGGLAIAAAALPLAVTGMLVAYLVLTMLYSVVLKRKLMVDVLCLAGLYTHRIFTGGLAVDVAVSQWLFGFSMFLFLSLAFAKRYTELSQQQDADRKLRVKGRGYYPPDLELIRVLGPIAGYISVLVFSLFVSSPEVTKLYHRPQILWLVCPLILYWLSRIWFIAHRQQLNDDPVVFALKDRISQLCCLVMVMIVVTAKYWTL